MNRQTRLQRVLAVSLLTLLLAPGIRSQTLTVNGNANIYGAGHAAPPAPGGGGAGALPASASFSAAPNQTLTFSSVTGSISCCGTGATYTGPDGYVFPTNILAYGGIAGIIHNNRAQFLSGVFLDNTEPGGAAPAPLTFTNSAFTELSPLLLQPFYIGDGLTGTGTGSTQIFHVPTGATRLFLGIVDGSNTSGLPGSYGDNVGAFTATFSISSVPEQTAVALLASAIISCGLFLRRKRKSAYVSCGQFHSEEG